VKNFISTTRNYHNYGKVYSKFPHDPLVRGHYFKLNKQYSRSSNTGSTNTL
jgi:hypothetical protein